MVLALKRFMRNESGQPAMEYCLLAGLIGILLIASLTSLGVKTATPFSKASSALP